ncbi:tetratricopeptide repeat protein [Kutzneria buriramensis]|uniref:Putative ATPase n=1 Tax=Kutzneria buriramensis TaxID=1045776 RepID=A0A3E0I099_9PSEU|nr:tetratricopeptide repeat protein [Kutzneria buriramensis]REH52051.1 putative ATPase [Kutzneria buriramensis]
MSSAERVCAVCGRVLADQQRLRYCSNACRQRAYRRRASSAARATIPAAVNSDIPGVLPALVDSFVGRRPEIEKLTQLIGQRRLVTLVGPAGVGKTRLALEVAGRQPQRAVLVELDSLDDGDRITQVVAGAFGVRELPGRTITEALFTVLRGTRTLLVLDNCEHLVDASARFVDLALRRCRGLRVLATSREALAIPGELVFSLDGLALPSGDSDPMRSDAVRLFVDRARERDQEFTLDDDTVGLIAAVCAELDGSPLAIELAAHRIPMLSVGAIHARLAGRFELLTTAHRRGKARQRSLRQAIDWSHQLLGPDEQVVFRRLSVLSGTFDLDTAIAVCADDEFRPEHVFELVFRLQAGSLVTAAGSSRLRMLESIRLYARERLDASDDGAATHDRLTRWLTELAQPLVREPVWFPLAAQRRLEGLIDNLMVAVRWTASTDDERNAVLTMATVRCWMPRGFLTEGRKLLRAALDRVHTRPEHRCLLLTYAGYLATVQGDTQEGVTYLAEALALARTTGDPVPLISALYTMGAVCQAAERLADAKERFTEALELAERTGAETAVAMVLERLALTAHWLGELDRADELITAALRRFRAGPVCHGMSLALHTGGTIALRRGELTTAEEFFADSLRNAPASWLEVPFALEGLAMAAGRRGDGERAIRLFCAARYIRGGDRLYAEPAWRRQVESSLGDWGVPDDDEIERIADDVGRLNREQVMAYALHGVWTAPSGSTGAELAEDEREVAALVAAGLTNPEIAARLGVSVRTVAYRLHRIRTKLGLRTRADVVAWADPDKPRTPPAESPVGS